MELADLNWAAKASAPLLEADAGRSADEYDPHAPPVPSVESLRALDFNSGSPGSGEGEGEQQEEAEPEPGSVAHLQQHQQQYQQLPQQLQNLQLNAVSSQQPPQRQELGGAAASREGVAEAPGEFVFRFGAEGVAPLPQGQVVVLAPATVSAYPQPGQLQPQLEQQSQPRPQQQHLVKPLYPVLADPPHWRQQQAQQQAQQQQQQQQQGQPEQLSLDGLSIEQIQARLREESRRVAPPAFAGAEVISTLGDADGAGDWSKPEIIVSANGSRFAKHRAHRDQNVRQLAIHYQTTVERLRKYNPKAVFDELDNLHGHYLLIPIGDAYGPASPTLPLPQESEAQRRARLCFQFRRAVSQIGEASSGAELEDAEVVFYLEDQNWDVDAAVAKWLDDVAWEKSNPQRGNRR